MGRNVGDNIPNGRMMVAWAMARPQRELGPGVKGHSGRRAKECAALPFRLAAFFADRGLDGSFERQLTRMRRRVSSRINTLIPPPAFTANSDKNDRGNLHRQLPLAPS